MNTRQHLKYELGAAFAGFLSGGLTLLAAKTNSGPVSLFGLGGVFGVMVSLYLAATGVSRRLWPAVRIAVICCAAYLFAFLATAWAALHLTVGLWSNAQNSAESPVAFFLGGTLGAFLVLSEVLFLLHPEAPLKESLLIGLCWSPVGGILGAIGSMIGSNPAADFYAPIFYLWQTGIGGVIGFFVGRVQSARQTPRQPILPDRIVAPSPRRLSLASMIFFLSIVGVFSFYIVRNIATEHTAAVRQNRIASAMASAPSARNLPPIVAIPMGDALVLHEISGSTPVLPSSRPMYPSTLSEPPTFDYSVGYQKMPMTSPLDYHPLVSIAITQYPNPEWARYQLKDVPVPNAAFYYEKYIQKVTKFGRVIYENTAWRYPDGRGHIYEYWASGPYIVIVTFRGPIDDEFLRPYLAKYPSTP